MLRPALLFAVSALSLACSSTDVLEIDEAVAAADGDLGKADGTTELKVRVGGTSLWVRNALGVRGDDARELVLRGRTSRNLVGGNAFVFDDVYGDFAAIGPRTFEVEWPLSTARGVLDGVDLFVGLDFVHSASRPDRLTSHVVVRPRLANFVGTSEVFLVAELTPVLVAGRVVYRVYGSAQSHVFGVDASAGETALGVGRLVDERHFEIDVDANTAIAILGGTAPITVRVQLESGFVEKSATLGAALHELGMTEGDPSEVWPRTCTDETLDCLQGLAPGTLDLAACGDAFTVTSCTASIGVFAGADEIAARVSEVDARLAGTFVADAPALVGADRVEAFNTMARSAIVADVAQAQGRWYLDAQARDAALATVVEDAFDRVYAFPLTGFPARTPVPGDEAATRQLVADALLAYLAEQDYLHSEFGRSYVELARVFRTQHVASLRQFREEVAREDYPGQPQWDVYVADWLGAYTEISVDKATGQVANVYVELD